MGEVSADHAAVMTIFSPLRVFLPMSSRRSLWARCTALHDLHRRQNRHLGVLLMMVAVVVFFIGLVSEQIATLRFDGRR
jgi:hypothetical protein